MSRQVSALHLPVYRYLAQTSPVEAMSGTPPSPTSSVEARNRMWRRCHEMWVRPAGGGAIRMTRQNSCYWCGKRCGFSIHGDGNYGCEPTLIDLTTHGLVCRPCFDRSRPPHLKYLQQLIGPFLNDDPNLAHVISEFAYPVCARPFRGFCCKRQPYWVGWTCPLCARVATGAVAGEGIYSNWYQGRMWGNGVGHWTNRGGWGITSGSDWQSGSGDRLSGSAGWQWGYWRL